MSTAPKSIAFEAAAERALRRVVVRRALALAERTLSWAVGGVALAVVLQSLGFVGTWLSLVVALGWLVGCALWASGHKPGKYEALALWDQVRQASEAFASAWWYGLQTERTPMQQRHLEAQALVLETALPRLAKELPLPFNHRLWLVPALACAGVAIGLWQHRSVREENLTDAMKATAVAEGKSIASTDWQRKKLEGLTVPEKQEIEKLKQDIKATASELQNKESQSARDVLNTLEKRAHEAEKLAKKLGNDGDVWASEKLVAELRKHADTADLGDAVASKNAAQAAKTAGDLAAQLKAAQVAPEFQQRLNESLKEVRKQSETEDRKRLVGSHVMAAGEALEALKKPEAAQEFEQLAVAMGDLARREQARKELEKLAQQLRDAGSRIAGNQGGGLQKMAGAGQQGAPSPQQQGQASQPGQQQSGANQAPLQPPGLAQAAPQTMLQEAQQPGAGQQQQMQISQMQPGQSPPPGSRPMLIAPVPGQKSDKPPEALIMSKDPPKETDGPTITLSAPGGPQAGQGTAKLDAAPTAPKKAGSDSQVNAARGTEGQSSTRSVEGGVSKDNAARSAQQTTVDFIKQEEEALDDAALPPARREQVRRYFTELRKRFEEGK